MSVRVWKVKGRKEGRRGGRRRERDCLFATHRITPKGTLKRPVVRGSVAQCVSGSDVNQNRRSRDREGRIE